MKNEATQGTPPLLLIDQSVQLVRAAGIRTWLLYLTGNGLYFLGLLTFIADMSRNPFASERLPGAALGMALLYGFHRTVQHVFCSELHASLRGEKAPRWTLKAFLHAFWVQIKTSAWSLLLLPLASLLVLPFAWSFAYHQNLVCRDSRPGSSSGEVRSEAKKLAMMWPRQNHIALSLLSLFIVLAFVNLFIAVVYTPFLLRGLLGLHTPFTDSLTWIGNTTFLGVLVALTYLCTDPFLKAVYVLRCHAGQSRQTGEDLLLRWRRLMRPAAAAACLMMTIALPISSPGEVRYTRAENPPALAEQQQEQVRQLEHSIQQNLRDPRYAWRIPKELLPEPTSEQGWFARNAYAFGQFLLAVLETIGDGIAGFLQWLFDWMDDDLESDIGASNPQQPFSSSQFLQLLAWTLIAILLSSLAIAAFRRWSATRRTSALPLETSPDTPDLEDEATLATDLPEDEWLQLAREMIQSGDYRKAVRACFLAALAGCDRLQVIEVSRAKSNREYGREIQRRGRAYTGLPDLYETLKSHFETCWYGDLLPSAKDCSDMLALSQRIRTLEH